MTKQSVETPEVEILGEVAKSKTEHFLEYNGRKIAIGIVAVILIAGAAFGYKSLIIAPTEQKAAEAIYSAQATFDSMTPDYQLALEGSALEGGFLSVIENYGSTPSGNLANHYAGVCYLKLGDLDSAMKYLSAYKPQKGIPAQIINAQNIGLQGDIAVERGDFASAVALFTKAAELSSNTITAPLYLRKAAQAAGASGDNVSAEKLYNSIISLYPGTMEAYNAEKYLGTIK